MSTNNDDGSVEPLLAHDNRTLAENYSVTDIADEYCRERLRWYGFQSTQYGKDDRHNTTEVTYGGRPDLCVTLNGEVVGYVEVKAKRLSSADWYGRCNEHQWTKYCYGATEKDWDGAENIDVPVFMFMSVVNEDRTTICKECVIPVTTETDIEYSFPAQGGKSVLQIAAHDYHPWATLIDAFNNTND